MAKYRVYLETFVSVAVTVEVPDNLDEDDAHEKAIEKAFEEAPSDVCAQCSGWGESWNRDLGELELERDADGKDVMPEKVTD